MAEDTISIATALQHTESLQQELRQLKMRSLIALLASTFLLYTWIDAMAKFAFGNPRQFFVYTSLFNVLAWLMWLFQGFLMGGSARRPFRQLTIEDFDANSAIEQYELTQHLHRRQLLVSAFVEMSLASQFIVMGLYIVLRVF